MFELLNERFGGSAAWLSTHRLSNAELERLRCRVAAVCAPYQAGDTGGTLSGRAASLPVEIRRGSERDYRNVTSAIAGREAVGARSESRGYTAWDWAGQASGPGGALLGSMRGSSAGVIALASPVSQRRCPPVRVAPE